MFVLLIYAVTLELDIGIKFGFFLRQVRLYLDLIAIQSMWLYKRKNGVGSRETNGGLQPQTLTDLGRCCPSSVFGPLFKNYKFYIKKYHLAISKYSLISDHLLQLSNFTLISKKHCYFFKNPGTDKRDILGVHRLRKNSFCSN